MLYFKLVTTFIAHVCRRK